jgi:hypothetical protein
VHVGCRANSGIGDAEGRRRSKGSRRKKKSDVPTYLPFLRLFEIFRSDFRKYFNGVFGLLMQRNGQKNAIKTSRWEKTKGKKKSQLFRPKVFDMNFPQKVFVVFLNSPC